MDDLRVLLVGDNPLARAGLAALLADHPGVVVSGQASALDGARGLSAATFDVVAWDLGEGDSRDLERLRDIQRADVPVLALVSREEAAPEILASGAHGVLLRDVDGGRLVAALRAVAQGLVVLDESLAETVQRPRPPFDSHPVEALTPREAEVLQLLAQGLSNRTIAERLRISEHTAKFHVNSILGKLGAQSRTEAIVVAARLGLVIL